MQGKIARPTKNNCQSDIENGMCSKRKHKSSSLFLQHNKFLITFSLPAVQYENTTYEERRKKMLQPFHRLCAVFFSLRCVLMIGAVLVLLLIKFVPVFWSFSGGFRWTIRGFFVCLNHVENVYQLSAKIFCKSRFIQFENMALLSTRTLSYNNTKIEKNEKKKNLRQLNSMQHELCKIGSALSSRFGSPLPSDFNSFFVFQISKMGFCNCESTHCHVAVAAPCYSISIIWIPNAFRWHFCYQMP